VRLLKQLTPLDVLAPAAAAIVLSKLDEAAAAAKLSAKLAKLLLTLSQRAPPNRRLHSRHAASRLFRILNVTTSPLGCQS
jgi:hypothetical protein